jgi:hypothetical protein
MGAGNYSPNQPNSSPHICEMERAGHGWPPAAHATNARNARTQSANPRDDAAATPLRNKSTKIRANFFGSAPTPPPPPRFFRRPLTCCRPASLFRTPSKVTNGPQTFDVCRCRALSFWPVGQLVPLAGRRLGANLAGVFVFAFAFAQVGGP